MMLEAFRILQQAFRACTGWFGDLVAATQSQNILIAAFVLCLVVAMLFMPMRGHTVASWVGEYKEGKIHKAQAVNRKKQAANRKKEGSNSKKG